MSALGYPTVLSLHDFFFACHLVHLIDRADQPCLGPERGERCIDCLHGMASAEAVRERFAYMTRVLQVPRRVLVPSAFLKRRIVDDFPLLQGRLQVITPGLSPPPVSAQSGKDAQAHVAPRRPGQPLRIVYLGILAPHKGAHVLIQALNGLPAERVRVSLYGAEATSHPNYATQLRRAAAGLPVYWQGRYDRSELGAILARHDVFVIPSICEESFSIVTREALHAGLPVIAARRGALPDVIRDGYNGLLFEPESADDLRRCLRRLLDEPDLLAQLAPSVSGPFPWREAEDYAQEVEQTYADVLTPSVRPPDFPLPVPIKEPSVDVAQPRLSVCLPTYNGEAYIAEAVQSVLQQSYRDFEIVAVDDGSSDRTLEILQACTDPRLRLYQNSHQRGIPGNWNVAAGLARGEYICVFHQDDVMLADNLARKMALFETDPSLSLVHSRAEPIIESDAPNRLNDWMEKAETDFVEEGEAYFRKLLLRGDCICAPTVVVRREQLAAAGGFNETLSYACDYEMWMKLCVEGRVGFLHDALVRYRWHADNASHNYQYERGVEECGRAIRAAVAYYTQHRGETPQAQLLAETAKAVLEQREWAAELERGRSWLEEQRRRWQELVEERERALQEQRAWTEELEKGKTWLEEQRAAQQDQMQEQQAWIGELEKAQAWLEEQRNTWEKIAQHWQAQTRQWQQSWWARLGTRLKLVEPVRELPTTTEPEKVKGDD